MMSPDTKIESADREYPRPSEVELPVLKFVWSVGGNAGPLVRHRVGE